MAPRAQFYLGPESHFRPTVALKLEHPDSMAFSWVQKPHRQVMASAHITIWLNFLSPFLALADFPFWWAPLDANLLFRPTLHSYQKRCTNQRSLPRWQTVQVSKSNRTTYPGLSSVHITTAVYSRVSFQSQHRYRNWMESNSPGQSHSKISQCRLTSHLPTQVQHRWCSFSTGFGFLSWTPKERAGLDFRAGL